MAIFVRRAYRQPRGFAFGRREFLGHVLVDAFYAREGAKARAVDLGRQFFRRQLRSCDYVFAEHDNGRRRWYGWATVPSATGVGLL